MQVLHTHVHAPRLATAGWPETRYFETAPRRMLRQCDGVAVVPVYQVLERIEIDGIGEEQHAAIGEQHVRPARMHRLDRRTAALVPLWEKTNFLELKGATTVVVL